MEIQCKQCKSTLRVPRPDAGKDLLFVCENCGCEMSLRTTLSGTSILSLVRGTQTMSNELRVSDEVIPSGIAGMTAEEIMDGVKNMNIVPGEIFYTNGALPDTPQDRNGFPINSKTGQIVYYRKQLAELEKQELYEECAQVRDRLNKLIYSDIK